MTSEKEQEDAASAPAQSRSVTAISVRAFIVICVMGGFSFHLYLQCIKYMNDPSIGTKETLLERSPFPDVTYCYPTFFNYERVLKYKFESRYKYTDDIFYKNLKDLWNFLLFNTTYEASLSLSQRIRYILPSMFTMLPFMTRHLVGSAVQDNLMECRFNGEKCDFLNFTTFWDGGHGLCFHFTPNTNKTIPGGITNGLAFMMHYKYAERVDITEIHGNVKIFVHPRNTYGTSEPISGLGQVGKYLNVEYTYVSANKLNTAILPCRLVESLTLCRIEVPKGLMCRSYKETYGMRKQVRLQNTLEERCNCISYEWPIPEKLKNRTSCYFMPEETFLHSGVQVSNTGEVSLLPADTSANVTSLSDIINITAVRLRAQCYAEFKKDIAKGLVVIRTDQLCNPDYYTLSLLEENSLFNTIDDYVAEDAFRQKMVADLTALLDKIENYNLTQVLFGTISNFMKSPFLPLVKFFQKSFYNIACLINVYPSMIAGRVLEDYFLYDLLYFIADMGGVTGLWVGMSIVTIFEIIEWIIWKVTKKCKKE